MTLLMLSKLPSYQPPYGGSVSTTFPNMADGPRTKFITTRPDPTLSPPSWDVFSNSLRILSYHLRELTLRAQIDKTLFWPEETATPTWPHLQKVSIMFHMVAPSGTWYFQDPRGEGGNLLGYELDEDSYLSDEEEYGCDEDYRHSASEFTNMHQFRVSPADTNLGPLLASFAEAAASMPELKYAVPWSPLRWEPCDNDDDDYAGAFDYFNTPLNFSSEDLARGLVYCAPGQVEAFETTPGGRKTCVDRNIWWEVGPWRPTSELHNLFRRIGEQRYEHDMEDHWNDGKPPQQDLPTRSYFEEWHHNHDDWTLLSRH
jgi:hypothetical protein